MTVEQVVSHMIEGKYSFMSTVDLANAYRSVMIRPSDRDYFGLCFDDRFYVDNCLCFGSCSAPFIFTRLTDAVCCYMRDRGIICFNYLDDIICLSKDRESGVSDQLELIATLRYLGFHIAWKKICSPTCVCTYLGVEINTELMCLRLPQDRVSRLKQELNFWFNRRKATEKQLQILAGHLSHCAHIIQGANLYMHFLFRKLAEARGKRKVKLTKDFHDDLSWWFNLACSFNSVPLVDVNTDRSWIQIVSGTYSVITHGNRFDTQPRDLVGDLVAGELSALWAYLYSMKSLSNCSIEVHCVSKKTWLCLKKSRVKHDVLAMLLRHVFWWSMERNVKLLFYYCPIG